MAYNLMSTTEEKKVKERVSKSVAGRINRNC